MAKYKVYEKPLEKGVYRVIFPGKPSDSNGRVYTPKGLLSLIVNVCKPEKKKPIEKIINSLDALFDFSESNLDSEQIVDMLKGVNRSPSIVE